MDKTLNNIEINIFGYRAYIDDLQRLHDSALDVGQPILAIHTKRALEGLERVVSFFEQAHSAILKEEKGINIPIVKKGRTKLTLIKGGKYDGSSNKT